MNSWSKTRACAYVLAAAVGRARGRGHEEVRRACCCSDYERRVPANTEGARTTNCPYNEWSAPGLCSRSALPRAPVADSTSSRRLRRRRLRTPEAGQAQLDTGRPATLARDPAPTTCSFGMRHPPPEPPPTQGPATNRSTAHSSDGPQVSIPLYAPLPRPSCVLPGCAPPVIRRASVLNDAKRQRGTERYRFKAEYEAWKAGSTMTVNADTGGRTGMWASGLTEDDACAWGGGGHVRP